jgi:hypothetical protein
MKIALWTGLCLLAVAAWVMFDKAGYVNRLDKHNDRFMHKFRELSTDLTQIDKSHSLADEFRHSSLYRIYHIGSQEISRRFRDTDAAHNDKTRLRSRSTPSVQVWTPGWLRKTTGSTA